jgi:hypothetical protein
LVPFAASTNSISCLGVGMVRSGSSGVGACEARTGFTVMIPQRTAIVNTLDIAARALLTVLGALPASTIESSTDWTCRGVT